MNLDTKELFSPKEVCELLGICKKTLYNWNQQGKMPYFKDDRIVRYRSSDIKKFLDSKTDVRPNPDKVKK